MRTSQSALLMPISEVAAVRHIHTAIEPAQRGDDLLDLGVEVPELALVRRDLLFEGRLGCRARSGVHAAHVWHASGWR